MKNWKKTICAGILICLLGGSCEAAIQMGDSGEPVRVVQKHLIEAGYKVSTDGRYGPVTARAVRLFQKRHHLSADGIVGPETYRKLTGDVMPDYKIVVHRDEKNGQCSQKQSGKKKSADSDKRNRTAVSRKALSVTKEAQKYIGIPYRFGGTDTHGFDCSGFIQYVFRQKGISLPRAADQQYRWGKKVSRSSLQPGDLVFFSTYEDGVSHSGIYVGGGRFISATTSQGIAVADMTAGYWSDCYVGAKRVL